MFPDDFKEWLQLLQEKKIRYLLVGGYAVAFHGLPRNTGDIDIWISREPGNIDLILEAMAEFGFSSLNLTKDDFIKPQSVIQLGVPPIRIDIITDIDDVDFEEAYKRKNFIILEDLRINLISLEDLIKNKTATDREIDRADVNKLSRLRK